MSDPDEMILVPRKTLSRLREHATRFTRGTTDDPEYLKRDLEFIDEMLDPLLEPKKEEVWFDIDGGVLRDAAYAKWGSDAEVGEPYWIDPAGSIIRVGIGLGPKAETSFGANFNYRTRQFL